MRPAVGDSRTAVGALAGSRYRSLLVLLALAGAQQAAARPSPPCSVTDRPVATRVADLPAGVRDAMAIRMADAGAPFNIGDAVTTETAGWPFARLICGYPDADGYVVEREQGGRGYNVATLRFRRTAQGFVAGSHFYRPAVTP